ncbi:MAG: VCBS repeat-containing protein, partial [Lentisphaerae bacterium]
ILQNADQDKQATSSAIMFGTFNGEVQQLWQMMKDYAAQRYYYPAVPVTRFSLHKIFTAQPASRIVVTDFDANGLPDLFLMSPPATIQVRLQTRPGVWTACRLQDFNLQKPAAHHCVFTDFDADGDLDLILGNTLYLRTSGTLSPAPGIRIPPAAELAIADLNRDGFPDLVTSSASSPLTIFFNAKGKKLQPYTPKSTRFSSARSRHMAAADFDLDGCTDLLYLPNPTILFQTRQQTFEPTPLLDEPPAGDFPACAVIQYITSPTMPDLYYVSNESRLLLQVRNGEIIDLLRFGNEIQDPAAGLDTVICADLNVDGNPDLIAFSSSDPPQPPQLLTNRGYGSFMLPEKYKPHQAIPQRLNSLSITAATAADLDGDGAIDLVLSDAAGNIFLMHNQTLANRLHRPEPSTPWNERVRIRARTITFKLHEYRALSGATAHILRLADNCIIASRLIATATTAGPQPPDDLIFTIRDPGTYRLIIRRTDNTRFQSSPFTIDETTPRHQIIHLPPVSHSD